MMILSGRDYMMTAAGQGLDWPGWCEKVQTEASQCGLPSLIPGMAFGVHLRMRFGLITVPKVFKLLQVRSNLGIPTS
jgi:hypothetical protein